MLLYAGEVHRTRWLSSVAVASPVGKSREGKDEPRCKGGGRPPSAYRFTMSWARDGLGPAGPSLLLGRKEEGHNPLEKKKIQPGKKKKKRQKRKGNKIYKNIFYNP